MGTKKPTQRHAGWANFLCGPISVAAKIRNKVAGLNSQTLTAFGATSVDDGTTATRLHTDTKAVSALATGNGWLVSTFHDFVNPEILGKALYFIKILAFRQM